MITTLRAKNQVTIPSDVIKKLKLHKEDQFDVKVNDDGEIIFTPIEIVKKQFIQDLSESFDDLQKGNVSEPMTADELINKLGM